MQPLLDTLALLVVLLSDRLQSGKVLLGKGEREGGRKGGRECILDMYITLTSKLPLLLYS